MKPFFVIMMFFLSTGWIFSQDLTEDPEVLIGSHIDNISGFGGVLTEFSAIDRKLGVSVGGGGAVLLNQVFYLGGYGMGYNGNKTIELVNTDIETDHNFGHGGFWLGYIFKPARLIHYAVDTKIGWGSINLYEDALNGSFRLNDNIFVFQPAISAEINIAYWFRINGGISYRLVAGVDNDYFTASDFNSPAFTLGFLFGWFKKY